MTQDRLPPARPWYDVVVREIALRGWPKTELSERSGVARTTIDNWNTNRRKPRAKAVNAVADTLGIERPRAHVLAGIVRADENGTSGEPEIPPTIMAAIDRELPEGDPRRKPFIEAVKQALSDTGPMPAVAEGPGRHRRRAAG